MKSVLKGVRKGLLIAVVVIGSALLNVCLVSAGEPEAKVQQRLESGFRERLKQVRVSNLKTGESLNAADFGLDQKPVVIFISEDCSICQTWIKSLNRCAEKTGALSAHSISRVSFVASGSAKYARSIQSRIKWADSLFWIQPRELAKLRLKGTPSVVLSRDGQTEVRLGAQPCDELGFSG